MKKTSYRNAFTLVEIMFVVGLLSLLLAGVMAFFVQNIKTMYAAEQRMKLAGQMKKFANELMVNASRANQFFLYKSPTLADFNDDYVAAPLTSTDRQIIDASSTPILHPAGDFVVFVYYDVPKNPADAFYKILKLEGYFLSTATAGGIGTLKKVEITFTSPSTSTVEAILVSNWNAGTSSFNQSALVKVSTYFPLVRGLALAETVDGVPVTGSTTPRLFYVSDFRNVLISGQVYTNASSAVTNDWKTYTDSFNFTITPRT